MKEGRRSGPAFASPSGQLASSSEYNAIFLKYLEEIQADTDLIEDKIVVSESFREWRVGKIFKSLGGVALIE